MNRTNNKTGKQIAWGALYKKYGILVVMALVIIAASLMSPSFLKMKNITNVLKQITAFGIVGAAETILIISGGIDLAAGNTLALSACLSASVIVKTNSVLLGILVAMLVGTAVSYASGILVTRFHLPPFIATLALKNVAEGITYIYTKGSTISGVTHLKGLGQGTVLGIPNMIILYVFVLVIVELILKKTNFGLYMYVIGGNQKASIAAGINVGRNLRLSYALSGALVGIAGIAITARMLSGQPAVGPGYEFDGMTATIVGGTAFSGGIGSMFCVAIGSIIIGVINNIMVLMGVDSNWQIVVKGLLIAVAVILDINTKTAKFSISKVSTSRK